jgi:hypothetical protein
MDATLLIVTLLSLALAATMSLVAWRVVREERRRSDARVAALAAEIHGEAQPVGHELFVTEDASRGSRAAIIAGAALGLGALAAVLLLTSSGTTAPVTAPISAPVPLELVALDHVRDGDSLVIRGAVRNAANGTPMDRVSVVVLAFGPGGAAVATERAPVDPAFLAPGGEAAFTTTVRNAAAVERYRVSFRSDERVVDHVDDRD